MIRSYKTGPILSVSHGIGMPSLKIIINEVCKALRYAGSLSKCHFFRSGTCGGIGVEPGKLVLTRLAVDQDMNPFYVQKTMCEEQHYPSSCVEEMLQEILDVAKTHHMDCVTGTTMTANGFYEDQARCDGFFCTFDRAQQKEFLTACKNRGITNFDMEAQLFQAFTNRVGIPGQVICTVIVNRMIVGVGHDHNP